VVTLEIFNIVEMHTFCGKVLQTCISETRQDTEQLPSVRPGYYWDGWPSSHRQTISSVYQATWAN